LAMDSVRAGSHGEVETQNYDPTRVTSWSRSPRLKIATLTRADEKEEGGSGRCHPNVSVRSRVDRRAKIKKTPQLERKTFVQPFDDNFFMKGRGGKAGQEGKGV